MATTISALTQSVVNLLGKRTDVAQYVPEAMGNAVRELSDNYPFAELQVTGPTVQFTPGQNAYPSSFFEAIQGANPFPFTFNKMISWWFYLQPPVSFSGANSSNPGYNLVFRDMENLEVLTNTSTLPQFWSQVGAQGAPVASSLGNANFYVAACPNLAYYTYARYQWLHPFTSPIALTGDAIYLPATWYDIIEYATAERIALVLRMKDVATRYHQIIFGDPLFEATSGAKGNPGLIFRRTSQTQKNQSRTTRSIRMIRRRY